jgi:hypothetical protein
MPSRTAAHSLSGVQQAKVWVDLWPNLAKQVQTFWKFTVHLYFLDNAPVHPCDGPTTLTSKMVGSQSHKVIVWERHELFIERRK